jgi:hypothetical protein
MSFRRKRRLRHTVPVIQSFGRILGPIFITSAKLDIMEPQRTALTCAKEKRLQRAIAQQKERPTRNFTTALHRR